jgi:NTP pyrophosphatase (non-canonical NTP hydrolase)
MSLDDLQIKMAARSRELFPECQNWTRSDWLTALVGEIGELANIIKKKNREPSRDYHAAMVEEVGDSIAYFLLLAENLNISAEGATIGSYNKVCLRKGAPHLQIGED